MLAMEKMPGLPGEDEGTPSVEKPEPPRPAAEITMAEKVKLGGEKAVGEELAEKTALTYEQSGAAIAEAIAGAETLPEIIAALNKLRWDQGMETITTREGKSLPVAKLSGTLEELTPDIKVFSQAPPQRLESMLARSGITSAGGLRAKVIEIIKRESPE